LLKRFGGFLALSLAVTAMFVVACGNGNGGGVGANGSGPEASSVPPTFIRVAVTAAPTETPTPTPVLISRDAPVFPEAFDPDLVDVRPEDPVIFAGWTNFLSNTELNHDAADGAIHCHASFRWFFHGTFGVFASVGTQRWGCVEE
jgi:hypothetical protein